MLFFLISCSVNIPKGFTYTYSKGINAGLDSLIDIDGYYLTQRNCDSSFFSTFVFYSDGLFAIATGSELNDVNECFFSDDKTILCNNIAWGIYTVNSDTIKTQTIRQEGMASCIIYRDYLIGKNNTLINISDYVNPKSTKIGYMSNYPSFTNSNCITNSRFFKNRKAKRKASFCPYINKKWFNQ